MITEKYKKALRALKAQSQKVLRALKNQPQEDLTDIKSLFQGCEAEADHIYRIMSAHNTDITEMTEELLERFMVEEKNTGSPYPNPDRDGLYYVDLGEDVEVYPCITKRCFCYPIDNQKYMLAAHDVKTMLSQLVSIGRLEMITQTLQSLAQRNDGTRLQTASPELVEVMDCIQLGLELPAELMGKIKEWELLGATEIHFVMV